MELALIKYQQQKKYMKKYLLVATALVAVPAVSLAQWVGPNADNTVTTNTTLNEAYTLTGNRTWTVNKDVSYSP